MLLKISSGVALTNVETPSGTVELYLEKYSRFIKFRLLKTQFRKEFFFFYKEERCIFTFLFFLNVFRGSLSISLVLTRGMITAAGFRVPVDTQLLFKDLEKIVNLSFKGKNYI